jgi:hypothetical protein
MNERGIALAITLFALLLLIELATVGFITGLEETRAGRNTVRMEHAYEAAEAGISQMLGGQNGPSPDQLPIGQAVPVPWTALAGPLGWYRGSVGRLSNGLFLLRSEGFSGDRLARVEIAIIARRTGPFAGFGGLTRVAERSFILTF